LLFDPRDGDDMSAAIAKLLAEPELGPGHLRGGGKTTGAGSGFIPWSVARQHVEIYREIMKDHPK